jgi:hypothetical protein
LARSWINCTLHRIERPKEQAIVAAADDPVRPGIEQCNLEIADEIVPSFPARKVIRRRS